MRHVFISTIILTLFCFFGCKKSEVTQVKTSSNLTGSVALFDESNSLVTDNSKTVVSIENSNPLISVPVNSSGDYQLPQLNESVTLVFTNEGFGTIKQYYKATLIDSIEKGLTSLQGATLYKMSSVVVNSLTGTVNGDMFTMNCNVSVPNKNALNAVRFFIQKNSSDISPNNCLSTSNASHTFPVSNGDNTINVCMKCEEQCGYKSGDTLYLKAYGDIGVANSYLDLSADKLIFPCVNSNSKSSTLSFIVP